MNEGRNNARRMRVAPRSWTVIGVIGALFGAALWTAAIAMAVHFIGKYW